MQTLIDIIKRNAFSADPKKVCFIEGENEEVVVRYSQLYHDALKILSYLKSRGLKENDKLIFQFEKNMTFVKSFWACILGRIIPVPVTLSTNEETSLKIFKIWNILKNTFLITDLDQLKRIESTAAQYGFSQEWSELKKKIIKFPDPENLCEEEPAESSAVKENDPVFIQFSSGSTGDPKGIILTHKNVMTNLNSIMVSAKFSRDDSMMSWMPLTHDMGLIGFHLLPVFIEIDHYIIPISLFVRRSVLWMIKTDQHRVTVLSSPNFGYRLFLMALSRKPDYNWDLSCVRIIFNGAEPISSDLCKEFLDIMQKYKLNREAMYTVYGMAEATLAVSFPPAGDEYTVHLLKPGNLSIGSKVEDCTDESEDVVKLVDEGYPVHAMKIRVCDDDDNLVPEDTVGNIQIYGDSVTSGYYNNEAATQAVFSNDGWLRTGDTGFMRNERLVVIGRKKEVIFINGQNIYPYDIERNAEGVADIQLGKIAVCGIYNNKKQSERIVTFVQYRKSLEAFIKLAQVLKNEIIAKMGIEIDDIIPVDRIPKTTSGKIQRVKLKNEYIKGKYCEVLTNIQQLIQKENNKTRVLFKNEVEKKLYHILQQFFPRANIGLDDNFLSLGGNSILLAQINEEIEKYYPDITRVTDLFEYPTIEKLSILILKKLNTGIRGTIIPERFFRKNGRKHNQDNSVYESICFALNEQEKSNIEFLIQNEEIDLDSLLIGVFCFLMAKTFSANEINITYLFPRNYQISELSLDISNFNDFIEIFKHIDQERKNPGSQNTYKLSELNKSMFSALNNEIPVLYYDSQYINTMNQDKLESFVILLEKSGDLDNLNVSINYNSSILENMIMLDSTNKYLSLLNQLTQKYKEIVGVKLEL